MTTRNFAPIEFEPTADVVRHSQEVYDGLRQDLLSSKHAARFELRALNLETQDDTQSPFNVDNPYLKPIESTDDFRLGLAAFAQDKVMPSDDWKALIEGLHTLHDRDDVSKHIAGGGVLKFIDSHRTYTGQVMQEIANWQVLHERGIKDAHEIQTTIASRATTLFKLSLLTVLYDLAGVPHHDGAIIEDILLRFGGVLLTIPNSDSGNKLVDKLQDGRQTRTDIVSRTKMAHGQLVNRGGSDGQYFFEGSSGYENIVDIERGITTIGQVKDRTIDLTTDFNKVKGAEKIMIVPFFMESNPYTGDPREPIAPKPTPFVILRPRIISEAKEFHRAMSEMAKAGTVVKSSGVFPYKYQKYILGDKKPDIIFSHEV